MMITHEFLTYQETVETLGASETARQAILTGDLPAYVEFNEVHARAVVLADGDALPSTGMTKYAHWLRQSRWCCTADPDIDYPSEDDYEEEVYYTLTGWFMMWPQDAGIVARAPTANVKLALDIIPAQTGDDDVGGFLAAEHFEVDYTTRLEKLWFRRAGVEKLLPIAKSKDNGGEGNKSLSDASEPKAFTYLSIIQAQAIAAKVSLHEGASRIVQALDDVSVKIHNPDEIARLLEAASKCTKDAYESARINKERTYQFDRATYQTVILALALLAKLPLRRATGPALKLKLRRSGFKGYIPSTGTLATVFKEVRDLAPQALLRP